MSNILQYISIHTYFLIRKSQLTVYDVFTFKDWWNSNSFASYYRMWNVVVHDWLYAYIYRDALYLLGDKYRSVAATGVFLISAVVHEYILGLTFRFFYPVLFFMFGGVGCKFFFIFYFFLSVMKISILTETPSGNFKSFSTGVEQKW